MDSILEDLSSDVTQLAVWFEVPKTEIEDIIREEVEQCELPLIFIGDSLWFILDMINQGRVIEYSFRQCFSEALEVIYFSVVNILGW